MSLLLLANVATGEDEGGSRLVDMAVQTDEATPSGGLEAPAPSPVHDYALTSLDLALNLTHDYFSRVPAPDHDVEHSYAFFTGKGDEDPDAAAQLRLHLGVDPPPLPPDVLEEPVDDVLLVETNWDGLADFDLDAMLRCLDEPATAADADDASLVECRWDSCGLRLPPPLEPHLQSVHLASLPSLRCAWDGCERTGAFGKPYLLLRHLRCHSKERAFACARCDKSYGTRELRAQHERRHDGERHLACPHCPARFVSTAGRSRHVGSVHAPRPRPALTCDLCSQPQPHFASRDALKKHQRRKHPLSAN